MVVDYSHLDNCKHHKKGHHLGLDDGLKASGDAVLGRHHPPVVPLTGTGIICTTIEYPIRAVLSFARVRSTAMTRLDMGVRHQSNSMRRGSK